MTNILVDVNKNVAVENLSVEELVALVKDTQNILKSVMPALSEILVSVEEFQITMNGSVDVEAIRTARDTLFMNMYSGPKALEVQEELLALGSAYGVLDEE